MRGSRKLGGWVGILALGLFVGVASADPPPPGEAEHLAGKPGAAALGAGTIFLTRVAIHGPEGGTVFVSDGQVLASLDQPVGSCRLRLRGARIPNGAPLTVESVASSTSPYEDRGISSVTWHFQKDDPAESLLCDTVGNDGPSQGDVEQELRGVLKVEAARPVPE